MILRATIPNLCLRSRTVMQCGLAILLLHASWAESEAQKITDQEGRTLEASILAVDENEVKIRRESDGKVFSIPIRTLSEASRELVQSFNKPEAAVPLPEISEELLGKFRQKWEQTKAQIPAVDADPVGGSGTTLLNELLNLEKDLIIAATPKDPATPIQWPDAVDRRSARKAEELRQSIRDVERELIKSYLGIPLEDRPKSRAVWTDRERLASLYEKEVKPLIRGRESALRSIAHKKKAPRPDQGDIDELKSEVEALEAQIAALKKAFYGINEGAWWDQDPSWPAEHPAEILRKEISSSRREYHERLIKIANHDGESEYRLAEVDGVSVYSSNFGVILDVSGSMAPHIEKLKKEIEDQFEFPVYKEVVGCALQVSVTPKGIKTFGGEDTMTCIEEMLLIYQVDTIYWFCDLNDPRHEKALYHLKELLRKSGTNLYVRSMDKRPDRELKEVIADF